MHRAVLVVHKVASVLIIQHEVKAVAVELRLAFPLCELDCPEIVPSCGHLDVNPNPEFFKTISRQQELDHILELKLPLLLLISKGKVVANHEHIVAVRECLQVWSKQ